MLAKAQRAGYSVLARAQRVLARARELPLTAHATQNRDQLTVAANDAIRTCLQII
jgi:hypothetical protein